ncbi:MFS transporter [Limobrevibacterium gyesilva]|uniref:MFS transporter n=1 Tax=Limobrevibacterium gyesilva TaxID=2991712 RepID=A0AA41YPW5_9PROT|nr:MFS transporter [Limobrevibacterium gyesilva]MCW3476546.1 MFS transporter [Limobrevibacterium gyesilva]
MLATILAPALARRGIHYGWAMVALTFLTMLSTSAAMGMPGVLLVPLRTEFGWDASSISGALALRLLLFGLVGPFAAALMLRYGLRRTVGAALAMIFAGLALATRMDALWHLWLTWGVLVGLATGITAMVLAATVANRWFVARRGLVLGLLTASSATGQLIFLPAAAWLSDHYGWRMALAPAALACLVCLALVLLLARDHPGELGLPAYGETRVTAPPDRNAAGGAVRLSLSTLAQASGTRVFWVLFFTFFVCGLSTNGIVQHHFIPLCLDFGMPNVEAAGVLAMMGAFDFVGTILSGWLSDRYDNRWLLFWYYGLRGISLLFLPYSTFSLYGLSVFAVFYGLDWVATVPPTIKLTASTFGRERAPLVFGWIFTAHQLGAATAALGAGVSRDALASYLPAFIAAGVACLLAALAIMAVRRPAPVAVART